MLLLDYKRGWPKNPIKQGFFATPFLREGKGRREERGQRSKKHHHFYTVFWGLKNGQEVVPPFWAPILKSATNPIIKAFPGKVGGSQFLEKAILERGQKTKMITVLGVFEFDAFLSCVFGFYQKGRLGAASPPPKDERSNVMSGCFVVVVVVVVVLVLSFLFCCCFCCFLTWSSYLSSSYYLCFFSIILIISFSSYCSSYLSNVCFCLFCCLFLFWLFLFVVDVGVVVALLLCCYLIVVGLILSFWCCHFTDLSM